MPNNGYTPTQTAMLEILADGQRHRRDELHACLPDELGDIVNIRPHITKIRKILRLRGEDIVCEVFKGERYYRLMRVLASPYNGLK